jgi:hypothetical protein
LERGDGDRSKRKKQKGYREKIMNVEFGLLESENFENN